MLSLEDHKNNNYNIAYLIMILYCVYNSPLV